VTEECAGELAVDAAGYREAAALFERWIPENQLRAHVALWLDGQELVIRVGDDEAHVPATGTWPAIVVSRAAFLIADSSELPDTGHLHLSVEGSRLRIKHATRNGTSDCQVHHRGVTWPKFIEQLTPFTMLEKLLLSRDFSDASIEYSGLAQEVADSLSEIRDLFESLDYAIGDFTEDREVDAAEVREVLAYLVGAGLDELSPDYS